MIHSLQAAIYSGVGKSSLNPASFIRSSAASKSAAASAATNAAAGPSVANASLKASFAASNYSSVGFS